MPQYFLGLDGGQSSTVALVADESGKVRGRGMGGGCDHERLRGVISESVRAAFESAGLPEQTKFAAASLGLSGGVAGKEALVRELIAAEHYSITTDAEIAQIGALAGEPGVIAIAGTGSIAFGKNAAGKHARAGGWGYAFGDEGGAFDVVRQALRAALREEEGWGTETILGDVLNKATGVANMNELLHRFYTPEFPRAKIASYAKLVDEAAREGDLAARDIMNAAAQALAMFVSAARRQLFHRGEHARISYIGGVFESEMVRERFRLLVELEGDGTVHPPAFGPAGGALIEAFKMTQLNVLPEGASFPSKAGK